ncbi:MAG: hypothetical protein J6D34_01250 [Atopobiaceae bacterium]|nr:hypothetical protein [Atopobiaceae bacterium]
MFDISIVDEEGSEVEISAPVDVQMELQDAGQLGEGVSAVHLGAAGVEVLDASVEGDVVSFVASGKWLQHSGGGGGIRFYTDNNNANNSMFEITLADSYHVPDDPYELDGKSFGIMRRDDATKGKAMMASSSGNSLDALPLTVMIHKQDDTDKLFIPADSGATMWTFEWVEDDRYYLKATVDGATQYLAVGQDGLSLVSSPEDCHPITVAPGTGAHAGQISLQAGGTTLTYAGSKDAGFNVQGEAGSEWLYLVQESELTDDYFMTYTATKVSVSDESVTSGSKLVVYTRIWNNATHKYEFYAIDHDGSLHRCYESGDQIQWVGSKANTLLWEFTEYRDEVTQEVNHYYELYNQYAEKYLAPLAASGQVLSDDPIGINLNGRRDGKYYTKIVAWDDANYAYSGLKDSEDNSEVLSCPMSEATDFYFAVVEEKQADEELGTVLLSKDLTGVDETETVMVEYPYQIFYSLKSDTTERQVDAEPGTASPKVVYKDTNKQVSYKSEVTVGGTQYGKVFLLKPGEVADIQFPEDVESYRIVECGVSSGEEGVYDHVYVNGNELAGTTRSGHYKDYEVEFDDPMTNAMVAYENHVNEGALRTLTLTKNIYEADGETPITYAGDDGDPSNNDQTTFDFRLSLGSEFDEKLTRANMYTYHVKDPEGYYCVWTQAKASSRA